MTEEKRMPDGAQPPDETRPVVPENASELLAADGETARDFTQETIENFFRGLPEEGQKEAVEIVNNSESNTEEIMGALGKLPFNDGSPETLEMVKSWLKLRGHEEKIDEVMEKKAEWLAAEENQEEVELVEVDEEEVKSMEEQVKEQNDAMKEALDKIKTEGATPANLAHADQVQEQARSKFQDWRDENPGILKKAKRGSRWIMGALLIIGVAYLAALNVVTGRAAAKAGGK